MNSPSGTVVRVPSTTTTRFHVRKSLPCSSGRAGSLSQIGIGDLPSPATGHHTVLIVMAGAGKSGILRLFQTVPDGNDALISSSFDALNSPLVRMWLNP